MQSTLVLVNDFDPRHSPLGIVWTAVTAAATFALAAAKAKIGSAPGDPVLATQGRAALIDGLLSAAVLLGLVRNALAGWSWADPLAGYVLVLYALREVRDVFFTHTAG